MMISLCCNMCEKYSNDEDDSEPSNLVLLALIFILFILAFLTIKLFRYRQMKLKCNNIIVTVPVIRKVYVADFSLLLPLAVLILLVITICVLSYSILNHKGEMVIGWEKNKSRKTVDYISPDNVTTVMSPARNPCAASDPPRILIIVCSTIDHRNQRTAIRNTWARDALIKFNISVLFLVGLSHNQWSNDAVILESRKYNDLIVERIVDTYNNLTLKSILLLKWVKQNCNNVKFVMKTDDDVYINMQNLANYIRSLSENKLENLLVGKLYSKEKPIQDRYNKWYMPCYMYPYEYYPSYVCGVGYLMSMNVLMKLYDQSFVNEMIHIEDVFITGICAREANVKPMNNIAFQFFDHPVVIECDSVHRLMILLSHQVTPSNMYSMHTQLSKCKNFDEDQRSVEPISSYYQS